MREISVPEGMLKAAFDTGYPKGWERIEITKILESALRWLSENPVVPTHYQVQDIAKSNVYYTEDVAKWIAEWQRRMFLAPEPVEEVKDLLFRSDVEENGRSMTSNERIKEAYRRGQKAGSK